MGPIDWEAFARHRQASIGLVLLAALILVALLTPYLAPFDPNAQHAVVATRFLPPSVAHPLGTDRFGRDVLSRVLYGARISLTFGFVAVAIAMTVGKLVGSVAGYCGRGRWLASMPASTCCSASPVSSFSSLSWRCSSRTWAS